MTIGERIKECRKSMGMTQEELAQRLDTTKQTIWKYEHDVIDFPLNRISQLADVFDVPPEVLTGWNTETPIQRKLNQTADDLMPIDKEVLNLFHQLSVPQRQMIIDIMNVTLRKHEY